jgi:hypothetical protein
VNIVKRIVIKKREKVIPVLERVGTKRSAETSDGGVGEQPGRKKKNWLTKFSGRSCRLSKRDQNSNQSAG